jgi:hypothetical protein
MPTGVKNSRRRMHEVVNVEQSIANGYFAW